MVFLLPSLHRMTMSDAVVEHYGKGTWFRASFLHVFTWLALSFLLANPPFADIGEPEVAAAWTVVVVDGEDLLLTDDSLDSRNQIEFILEEGQDSLNGEVWLLFGIRDNLDAEAVQVSATLTLFDGTELSLNTSESSFENLSEWGDSVQDADGTLAWPTTVSKEYDRGMAIRLSTVGLTTGVHVIDLTLSEDGDPWKNSRDYSWKIIVSEPPVENTE